MIYDMRTYTLKPGALQQYMDAVRDVGLPVRQKYGIKLAGWYYSEFGSLNQVVHIWAFRDWEHMEEGKKQFRTDPQWINEYAPRVRGLIVAQEDKIVLSPDFAPQPH
jgi:hypothetical protein